MNNDGTISSPEEKHALLTKVLKSFKFFPAGVLSLESDAADGLELFGEQHQLRATVSDKEQLKQRKKALPEARLYAHSLTGFRIPKQVQLAYLLDHKINTLTTKKRWTKMLSKVHQHLKPYGLFVFDIWMDDYFQQLQQHAQEITIWDGEVTISNWKSARSSYQLEQVRFAATGKDDLYSRHDREERYMTVSLTELKKMLSSYEQVIVLDSHGRKTRKKLDQYVIVAQKGRSDK